MLVLFQIVVVLMRTLVCDECSPRGRPLHPMKFRICAEAIWDWDFIANRIGCTHLAEFRHEKGDPRPLDLGRRASCGTRTVSMKIDPVREARRETLFLIAGAERPFIPCYNQSGHCITIFAF